MNSFINSPPYSIRLAQKLNISHKIIQLLVDTMADDNRSYMFFSVSFMIESWPM